MNLLLLLTLEVISLNLWDCIPLVKNPLESPTLTSTYISSAELVTRRCYLEGRQGRPLTGLCGPENSQVSATKEEERMMSKWATSGLDGPLSPGQFSLKSLVSGAVA